MMLRFRRYRVFLALAVFGLLTLYYFSRTKAWEEIPATVKQLKHHGHSDSTTEVKDPVHGDLLQHPPIITPAAIATTSPKAPTSSTAPLRQAVEEEKKAEESTLRENEDMRHGTTTSNSINLPTTSARPTETGSIEAAGHGRFEAPPPLSIYPTIHWQPRPDHFPVPDESVKHLPTGKPIPQPRIQHAFRDESPTTKALRLKRLGVVKEAFDHSWRGYREQAWRQDELVPVDGGARNPFNGWAATLVDALDALWIMGMEDEFQKALEAVAEIDFTTSPRADIPLFETTIRYLGGLLGAYDISGGKHKILISKAVELAEVLMGAFDTPNRMPQSYYQWKPSVHSTIIAITDGGRALAANAHRAETRTVLAELGSLSMEFTRLAQITKNSRYYDAVARITDEFDRWQNNTKIPGLWPISVDASGCKKPTSSVDYRAQFSASHGPEVFMKQELDTSGARSKKKTDAKDQPTILDETDAAPGSVGGKGKKQESSQAEKTKQMPESKGRSLDPRQLAIEDLKDADPAESPPKRVHPPASGKQKSASDLDDDEKVDCIPQGLASPPNAVSEDFAMGGQADSVYEYLPKQFLLLGGLIPQYRHMYETAITAANRHLLLRPMLPDDRDVLALGFATARSAASADGEASVRLIAEQQHLLCFAGGMYALGARIFGREAELETARKLTDGCVWSYQATPTGIMPERFSWLACEERNDCQWNETRWMDAVTPGWVRWRGSNSEKSEEKKVENEEQNKVEKEEQDKVDKKKVEDTRQQEAKKKQKSGKVDSERDQIDEAEHGTKIAAEKRQLDGLESIEVVETKERNERSAAGGKKTTDSPPPKQANDEGAEEAEEELTDSSTARTSKPQKTPAEAARTSKGSARPNGKSMAKVLEDNDDDSQAESTTSKKASKVSSPSLDSSQKGEAEEVDSEEQEADEDEAKAEHQKASTAHKKPTANAGAAASSPSPTKVLEKVESSQQQVVEDAMLNGLPKGMTTVIESKYILRPEAIESIFIMYRITGDETWRDKGWTMFEAITKHTRTAYGYSALADVTTTEDPPRLRDEMESFWLAETLKYFYLLFSEATVVSLDDYVFNTEAHPFKRPT